MSVRIRPVFITLFFAVFLAGTALARRTAEDRLRGKIILSTKPFPRSFKSDNAMVKHMKKVNTKAFRYNAEGKISIELMGFFARAHTATEFTATVYDVTEGRRSVNTFPIYPAQKSTRVLASFIRLDRETYQADHEYMLVITPGYNGAIIAETTFVLQKPKGEKKPVVKPTRLGF